MGYRNLTDCVRDLERTGQLRRIDVELDGELEIAAVQRRVFQAGGPALLFTRVKGCAFPMLGNLFGTMQRTRFLFRDTLPLVQRLLAFKTDPAEWLKSPGSWPGALRGALHLLPRKVGGGPVIRCRTRIDKLPGLKSWPKDGGPFITLPQVYSESIAQPGWRHSNLGMYRVQLAGNRYRPNQEIGLHYQLHRGIGIHHAEALKRNQPLRVNIFVGGPPCLTVAAVMPLPEGMPELCFAGLLGGRRIALINRAGQLPMPAEADFCISGTIVPDKLLPEGPFGDHLGYYSLQHDFPVLAVDAVYHRPDAIWPFTSVGRPPQEDSVFGAFIHELTGPMIPELVPGVHAVHAVDAAGVHPLLLAIGSERYLPYETLRQPRELLTQANALLGTGQLSLAKYLLIVARQDAPRLNIHDVAAYLRHLLERVDWRRDLHFQTRTSIDTLDYSGPDLHQGSKVVIAAAGPPIRTLSTELPCDLSLPQGFSDPRLVVPGVLAIQAPPATVNRGQADPAVESFCAFFGPEHPIRQIPWVVLVDDSRFTASHLDHFLWVAFTRSDPATDLYGVDAGTKLKHWGCSGPLVLDARLKPHHPAPLEDDPATIKRIEAMAARGGPLHGIM
ncbi:UbiD family decarboxylase [Syntrophotalea carbinolica DSM 2380]|uniref:UbiD family decarboxylase n=1 Tax=Syntrophotalea carbinolica (strain DSM 2380 / NBRC 103641 / GraBd1) TaxID=338963 RepID=Q3A066_SYNC1|nr:UbiD family decarboxylase [Syntrophotalea carbinolica]ABA90241.1 UbiD family decarboxylase [Syntrophotalea carbinolica DSM 2380]